MPIERDSEDYHAAIDASEEAIKAVEGNNGYAESESEERNAIVHSMKGTLAAIKEGLPSRGAIVEGLLKPLQFISKKFSGALIGEAAKKAAAAIISWLSGG